MSYNFKLIKAVLNSKDLINVVLSQTQRKTPTVVHPGYNMGRIKSFYIRKVKFTQDTIQEKLTEIINGFPKLEDIHPFFSDLINVLYDKDHYKLALGHIHSCKNLIDNITQDYVRLIKYGDSLYRCKMLKKAGLGRMCTILKKLNSSLQYLEEVRKHMSRLPSINPFEKTLLITGFPNVGKSSFINQITHANVEVQPYPFTTQSLYVGHTDFNYTRWQVIDSPGILDRPLEQRNTIEMQSITALAHLKACILFFIDISEQCSYSIEQQISLFNNIKPLFKNKPLVIALSKIDLRQFEELPKEQQLAIQKIAEDQNVKMTMLSNQSGEGIVQVKEFACAALEDFRQNFTPELLSGGNKTLKQEENVLRGVYVAYPQNQDDVQRPPHIPEDILKGWKRKLDRPTLKEIQEQNGGAGSFNFPLQEHFILENPDWKYDVVPEIWNGKNIVDFVDKDILEKLEDLEREEDIIMKARENEMGDEEDNVSDLDSDLEEAHKELVSKRAKLRLAHKMNRHQTAHVHQPTESELKEKLGEKADNIIKRARSKTPRRKLPNLVLGEENKAEFDSDLEIDMEDERNLTFQKSLRQLHSKQRSLSRSRSKGFIAERTETDKALDRLQFKIDQQWEGRAGEGDRRIPCQMPKHLYSGKRGIGKNDRR